MVKDLHRKAPAGFLTFSNARDQLKVKGFGYEQIDHLDGDNPDGPPLMMEIIATHQTHRKIEFSFELFHENGMKVVKESEFRAGFNDAVERVSARVKHLKDESQSAAETVRQKTAQANAILQRAHYDKLSAGADNGVMVLSHADYPEFRVRTEFPSNEQLFNLIVSGRAADFMEEHLPDHVQRLGDLERSRGVTISRTNNALLMEQPELGVRKAIAYAGRAVDDTSWRETLQQIDSQINVNNDPQTMQLRLKRLQNAHGFRMQTDTDENGLSTLVLSHPDARWGSQSARLIGTHGLPGKAAMELIAAAEEKAVGLRAAQSAAPSRLPLTAYPPRTQHAIKPTQIDMVFDTSVLAKLGTPREGGRTWLDMVRLASTLPNVDVILPSTVAYELSGALPHIDTAGNKVTWQNINPRFASFGPDRVQLIEEASHIIGDADGGTFVIKGANPKLSIWHSPGQNAFFHTVKAGLERVNKEYGSGKEFFRQLRESNRDIGEQAALAYCHSPQSQRPVVIVVEDNAFFQQFLLRCKSYPRGTDTYTQNGGHAISKAATPSFVRTLNEAFGDDLIPALEKFGGREVDATLSYVLQQINEALAREAASKNRDRSKNGGLTDNSIGLFRGRDKSGNLSPPLGAIFEQGVALLRHNGNGHANSDAPAGNGHGNGHSPTNGNGADTAAGGQQTQWREREQARGQNPPTRGVAE